MKLLASFHQQNGTKTLPEEQHFSPHSALVKTTNGALELVKMY